MASFEVKAIAGKGQGLFATRFIATGQLILRENPLIVMPNHVFEMEDMRDLEDWLERRVNKMSSDERSTFLALSDCRRSGDEDKTYCGIFFTNDMDFNGDAALFPLMAKANHACVPNADFVSRPNLGVQDLMAIRDIQPGEEITLSYLPAGNEGSDVKSVRQAYTREWYGFQCSCQTCCLKGEALKADEKMRRSIRAIQKRDFKHVSLSELEELLVNLEKAKSKLPYQMDMNRLVFERALAEGNFKVAARIVALGHMYDTIVNPEDAVNSWDYALKSIFVQIGHQIIMFPA